MEYCGNTDAVSNESKTRNWSMIRRMESGSINIASCSLKYLVGAGGKQGLLEC